MYTFKDRFLPAIYCIIAAFILPIVIFGIIETFCQSNCEADCLAANNRGNISNY